jgi:YesN/AraC family two-component response regulator
MVSNRCKLAVQEELTKLGLHYNVVELGEVDLLENITKEQQEQLQISLLHVGLELMVDRKTILIERIKNIIIETIHHSEETVKINFSHHLSEKLDHDYAYLANIFTEGQGTTIEKFLIFQKVEKIKELLTYGDLTVTEISNKLNYSSVAHLSKQFKKVAGIAPSQFLKLKNIRRQPIEEIGTSTDDSYIKVRNDTSSKNKIKLFLVDDDPVFLKLLEIQFSEHKGFTIETYTTGELCIEHLHHNPDIIICDYEMNTIHKKAMTGIETLDKIKSLNAAIPVVMLSSQDKIAVAVDCLHHKAADYVIKNKTSFMRLQKIISTLLSPVK